MDKFIEEMTIRLTFSREEMEELEKKTGIEIRDNMDLQRIVVEIIKKYMSDKVRSYTEPKVMEKVIFENIVSYIQEHGYSPCVREIGEMVGLKSTSSVQAHLEKMYISGLIETDERPGTPRAIRVPGYKFVRVEE